MLFGKTSLIGKSFMKIWLNGKCSFQEINIRHEVYYDETHIQHIFVVVLVLNKKSLKKAGLILINY